MVIIVNTTTDNDITAEIRTSLDSRSADYEIIEAADLQISHCIGCNCCWLKTPGICAVKDDYEMILKKLVNADSLWVISNTALGFIDYKGKNIFDRLMPLATMFLKFSNKQMRHVLRYDNRIDTGLIYCGEADRKYLERWNERAALNFGGKSLGVYAKDGLKEAVSCMR